MNWTGLVQRQDIIDAVRSRLALQDRLVTGLLIITIFAWYFVEIAALFLGWDVEFVQWMFTTDSFPALSPGLFLAIISHAYPPRITHLFGNAAGLWLFAGESEQHMTRIELVSFFVGTSLSAVVVGTAVSGESTMGASGGVMGFLGFYCVHMTLEHREKFDFEALTSERSTPLRTYIGMALVLTPVVLIPYLIGQLFGIIPAGRTDVVGHFFGFACGIIYSLIRGVSV